MSDSPDLTIAIYSQVPAVPKHAAEDTSLTVDNADGGKTTFPIPSGTVVELHLTALHYNRMSSLLPSQGPVLSEVLQRSIGRIPTLFDQSDSLESGHGMRSCHLVQVGLIPS